MHFIHMYRLHGACQLPETLKVSEYQANRFSCMGLGRGKTSGGWQLGQSDGVGLSIRQLICAKIFIYVSVLIQTGYLRSIDDSTDRW
jgi:hypothetical protein